MDTTGFPSPARDFEEGELDLNSLIMSRPYSTFLLRVEGENDPELAVNPGDILVVDRSVEPQGEDIVVSSFSGELILSIYGRSSDQQKEKNSFGDNNLWGVVTWVIHRTK